MAARLGRDTMRVRIPHRRPIKNNMQDPELNRYIDIIDNHLKDALSISLQIQEYVMKLEGDSDLFRKVAFYLTPYLNHWIQGAQAGSIKDLKETLERRTTENIEKK